MNSTRIVAGRDKKEMLAAALTLLLVTPAWGAHVAMRAVRHRVTSRAEHPHMGRIDHADGSFSVYGEAESPAPPSAEEEAREAKGLARARESAGRLRRRLRRRKDAATLIEISSGLSDIERDDLYLSPEVSLTSVAAEMWSELGETLPTRASAEGFKSVVSECSAGFAELGRAAQASLTSGDKAECEASLESAGERAKRAIENMEQLAGTYVDAADELRVLGANRLDEAWRRDALRAVLALQRAPTHRPRWTDRSCESDEH